MYICRCLSIFILGTALNGCGLAMIPVNIAAGKAFHGIMHPDATGGSPQDGSQTAATQYVQSSVKECPGWALAHGALQYPMPKAVEIIESMTVAAKPTFSLASVNARSEEEKMVGQLIKTECDNPNPTRDYTKLGWVCPTRDPESPQKWLLQRGMKTSFALALQTGQ